MDIEEIKKSNFTFDHSRRMTYQKVRLYYFGYLRGLARKIDFHHDQRSLYCNKKGDLSVYVSKLDTDFFKEFVRTKLMDKSFNRSLPSFAKGIERDFMLYSKKVRHFRQDYTKYSNRKLINYLGRFNKLDRVVEGDYWIVFNQFAEVLTDLIENILGQKHQLGSLRVSEIISILSQPDEMIAVDRERLSILQIALLPVQKREKALLLHHHNFAYMPMYDINFASHSLEYFRSELQNILAVGSETKIRAKLTQIKNKYRTKKNKESIISEFRGDRTLQNLLNFYRVSSYLKEQKPFARDMGNYSIRPLFEELAKRCNMTLDQVLYLTEKEIFERINGSNDMTNEEIDSRVENSIFYCRDGRIEVVTQKENITDIYAVLQEKTESETSGLGVNTGKVVAPVSIIISNNDFHLFEAGNVLVTSATRPDYLPLMKQAAAIVTNEGGMLSHAAIVSRELGVPCIVGTKNATLIFKDGDIVEVDASAGTVRIVKKK